MTRSELAGDGDCGWPPETFRRGEQGAPAVALDAAAFKDQAEGRNRGRPESPGGTQPHGGTIVQVCRKLESPTVESEIEKQRSCAILHRNRTKIADPGVVGRHFNSFNPLHDRTAIPESAQKRRPVRSQDHKPFKSAYFFCNLKKYRLHLVKEGKPQSLCLWGQESKIPSCRSHSAGSLLVVCSLIGDCLSEDPAVSKPGQSRIWIEGSASAPEALFCSNITIEERIWGTDFFYRGQRHRG